MKHIFTIIILTQIVFSIPLYEVYENASPMNGYDKYLILERNIIYTGNIGVYEGNVFIEGNGATIDLEQGNGIWIYSDENYPASIVLEYVSIINSSYFGISFSGSAEGIIKNCNFISNDYGISLYDSSNIEVKNSNFINSTTYGIAIYTEIPICNISYCNFYNNDSADYMENCPG